MSNKQTVTCGIAMPISAADEYSEEHWAEVRNILIDTIKNINNNIDLRVKPVWEEDYVNIIQKSIVNNIYQNDIVIFDLSSLNPNVMFELGLRLAFDKPVVIIRDNQTKLPFDTTIIEALTYDKGLKYQSIEKLKKEITIRVLATLKEKEENGNYSPFLKSFGTFYTVTLNSDDINSEDKIINMLSNIQEDLRATKKIISLTPPKVKYDPDYIIYRLQNAINLWCKKEDCTQNKKLMENESFNQWIIDHTKPLNLFDNHDDLRRALELLLSQS
ncbi:hypothetical protein [Maridesulfovibrio hydrothermalis]|uniref:Nucleoside 2-deoxyribosyltransferase n=1 Tax=Maridesulfovibrio hydrothermalis AM13 = DSM 14728 TaxID=1121451 RepID=L0R6G6_9BACT|nr:hypothetical protein [Maridesulfovibrio hydrothermalis]CCO22304.1 exported protein of unknown function [Maridesulfovibrio hydrothermalis AM13 = DSM 14728]